jgi:S-formylglutathione hydrolase FrmB
MRGIESNVAAFVVRPTVRETSLSNLDETADDLRTAQVTVEIDLPIAKTQRVVLLLNERSITKPAAYLFDALPRTEDTNSITFSLYDVKPGEYLVRVQVDGAESLLNVDTNSNSPTFEQYIGPTVVIP